MGSVMFPRYVCVVQRTLPFTCYVWSPMLIYEYIYIGKVTLPLSEHVQNLQCIRIIIFIQTKGEYTLHVQNGYTYCLVHCHTCLLTQGIISSVLQFMWVQGGGGGGAKKWGGHKNFLPKGVK
jgi:hypothetical protein